MNIFNLKDDEFERKIDEIFDNIDSKDLLEDLINCGLEIQKIEKYNTKEIYYIEKQYDYSIEVDRISIWDKLLKRKYKQIDNLEAA